MFVSSEIEVENYSFLQAFVRVSIASRRVHYTKPLQQKTVPTIFSKNRQSLPDTFLMEMRKKKMGVTVLVFDLRTKLSPNVIDTVAKRPK